MITIADVRSANRAAGFHWFDPAALRWFRSRVHAATYQTPSGCLFVSSEQYVAYDPYRCEPRKFTVRRFTESTGEVDTVGDFQEFGSRSGAHAAAARIAADELSLSLQE